MTLTHYLPTPLIITITGNMAAGKSTVAQALAERLPRSVHLRGDAFRRMIVNGRAEMGFELSSEATDQLWLRYQIAAAVADLYMRADFTVVYQDIVIGPQLAEVVKLYRQHPCYVVVLCPAPDVIAARDEARGKTGYSNPAAIAAFDHVLQHETPRIGLWIDNGRLSVAATVDQIIDRLPDARIDQPPAP